MKKQFFVCRAARLFFYGQNQFLNVYWNELEDLLNKQTQTNSLLEEQIKAINEMKGYVKDKDEGGFKRFLKNKGIDLVIKILGGAISKELHEFLVNLS